ncbi:glycosyltransferase family 2 protein [Devosia marina]|uniref:Glycosyltransferase n=1 Tax=Devosia marina TaxID=2683198 RepID=A0A7X3K215_9HYPH|nr:glycosyltransferase family 2 protein [Devosia marina]MVS97912.1 glycosyltransferase [Devosia marina]
MPILPRPIKFGLTPIGDIETLVNEKSATNWLFTGADPRLLLTPSKPMPPGTYKLEFVDASFEPDWLNAKLYLDTGSDFSEGLAVSFPITKNQPAGYFELGQKVLRLRLDPHDGPGALAAKGLRLTRISTTLHRAARATRLAAARVRSFDDAVRLLTKSYRILRKDGIFGLQHVVSRSVSREVLGLTGAGYAEWVRRYDTFSEGEIALMKGMARELSAPPLISVLMPVYNAPKELLIEAIESVVNQVYQNWQLCIADDASTEPEVRAVLESYAAKDPRINVVFRERNGHISEASNSALEIVRGDWFALLDHDDVLRPHALLEIAIEVAAHPGAGLIYSDEDKIDGKGNRYDPFFKPDFSIHQLRSQNYFNHLTVHRTELVRAVGGWRKGFEGSQDYDLNLRIVEKLEPGQIRHIPKVLYHWRAAVGSTASAGSAKSYAYLAGLRALEEHAGRSNPGATAKAIDDLPVYRFCYPIPVPPPLISLIIPTRDRLPLIKGCVDSILDRTDFRNFEILVVDNGSVEPETIQWFDTLEEHSQVRVLSYDKPFNYSAINNFAAGHARGSIIGLINNDIEVISPGWLGEMVSLAVQDDVGCVGAKLYYANDTIQHAGVVIGIGGVAGHDHKHAPAQSFGYFSRLKIIRGVSAVTAACLLVRKSVFEQAGGLEVDLEVAFNDVDFCLKVEALGYHNVWTPYAELYHLESISRGAEDSPEKVERFNREVDFMKKRWGARLGFDIYYSPNLSIAHEDYSIAFPPRIKKMPGHI